MIEVRRLTSDELDRAVEVDVSETDDTILERHADALRGRAENWSRPPRDAAGWAPFVVEWRHVLADGGAAWGALDATRLRGVIVLRRRIRPDTDQLLALFVDQGSRRQGIASALIAALVADAAAGGARRIVVSATPSRSAVGTYQRHGFRLADHPLPELLAREPEDIHMVRELDRASD